MTSELREKRLTPDKEKPQPRAVSHRLLITTGTFFFFFRYRTSDYRSSLHTYLYLIAPFLDSSPFSNRLLIKSLLYLFFFLIILFRAPPPSPPLYSPLSISFLLQEIVNCLAFIVFPFSSDFHPHCLLSFLIFACFFRLFVFHSCFSLTGNSSVIFSFLLFTNLVRLFFHCYRKQSARIVFFF